jgi:hypothetical protein
MTVTRKGLLRTEIAIVVLKKTENIRADAD